MWKAYEGKVCRFRWIMHDMYTEWYERRFFVINWYLWDNTASIQEIPENNSGRSKSTFLSRNTLYDKNQYPIQLNTFRVGGNISIMQSDFFIYETDAFTRDYFLKAFNIQLQEEPIDVKVDVNTTRYKHSAEFMSQL